MKNKFTEAISLLMIILFLYTGVSKLAEFSVFKEQIAATPIFEHISKFVAFLLPTGEFVVAILLFWPAWRLFGLYASLCLMTLFTGYIIYIMNVNDNLPCSCGGIIELLSWKGHLVFNIVMIVLIVTGIILSRRLAKQGV